MRTGNTVLQKLWLVLRCGQCTIHCPNTSHTLLCAVVSVSYIALKQVTRLHHCMEGHGGHLEQVTVTLLQFVLSIAVLTTPDGTGCPGEYVTELPRSAMFCSYSLECFAPFVALSVRPSLFRATFCINGGLTKLA